MADPDFEWQGPPAPPEKPEHPAIQKLRAYIADNTRTRAQRERAAMALDKLGYDVGESLGRNWNMDWNSRDSLGPAPDHAPPPDSEQLAELKRPKPGDRTAPPSYYDPRNEGHYRPVQEVTPDLNPQLVPSSPYNISMLPGDPLAPLAEAARGTVFYEPSRRGGETEEQYRQRADDTYRAEIDRARARDQTVQRHRDIDTGTVAGAAQKTALGAFPYLGAMANNLSQVQAFGVPDRAMGALMPEAHQSLQTLSSEGVELPGFDYWNPITSIIGAAQPRTLSARMAGRVAKATGATSPGAQAAAQVLGGAASGATAPLVETGVDLAADAATGNVSPGVSAAGRVIRGQGRPEVPQMIPSERYPNGIQRQASDAELATQEVGRMLLPVGIGAGFGAGGGAVAHLMQRLAGADMQARRMSQHDLVPAENAGIYPAPKFTAGGFSLPPRIAAAERMAARQPVTQPRTPGANLDELPGTQLLGTPAEDITARAAARRGARGLQKFREGTRDTIDAEKKAFYGTPEGQARYTGDQPRGPLEAIEGIITKATDPNGRPLPTKTVDVYSRYAGMFRNGELVDPRVPTKGKPPPGATVSVEEARAMGIPIDEVALDKMAADTSGDLPYQRLAQRGVRGSVDGKPASGYKKVGKPTTVKNLRGQNYELPNKQIIAANKAKLEKILRVHLSPRDFNAEELETTIKGFQDEVSGISANARSADVERKIVGALTDMRKQFKRNPGDKETWSATRERHHGLMEQVEDSFRTVGLPIKMDDVDPETRQVFGSVLNTLRRHREEGSDGASLQKLLNRLAKEEPGLQEAVDRLAGHRAYKRLRNQDGEVVRGTASKAGIRAYGAVGDVARAVARGGIDPLEAAITGAPRPKPRYPQSKKKGGQVSPELDTRKGRGLAAARGGRIGNLAAQETDALTVFAEWVKAKIDAKEGE